MKYSVLIAAFVAAVILSFLKGMDYQAIREEAERQEAQKHQSKQADTAEKQKTKIEVVYRDRIKTIYMAPDPTGCLDTTLGDIGLYAANR